jgi:hypothetical protein
MSTYDHAKFLVERFDHYYDSVNNKGAFYIGLNTFIFGGICVGYITLHNDISINWLHWFLFALLLLANLLSLLFTVWAIMPFLTDNHNQPAAPSLIYFGGIAKHELPYFKEKFSSLTDPAMLDDLMQQVHCLARGLDSKYKKLKRASQFVIVQFIVMIPLLLLIVNNLKDDL